MNEQRFKVSFLSDNSIPDWRHIDDGYVSNPRLYRLIDLTDDEILLLDRLLGKTNDELHKPLKEKFHGIVDHICETLELPFPTESRQIVVHDDLAVLHKYFKDRMRKHYFQKYGKKVDYDS